MLQTPGLFSLVASKSEGLSRLTAFDKALLGAGVGNCNLLKVSSILPPNAKYVDRLYIPEGSLLPIAYASMVSDCPGQTLCAGVAIGIGEPHEYGVIMEYHGLGTKEDAEKKLVCMVQEAFVERNRNLRDIKMLAIEHTVISCGCAFAAVPLWY